MIHFLHRCYKTIFSTAFATVFSASCRFYPTCSVYSRDALTKHGWVKGTVLSLWRLLRCQPFSRGGVDPVPSHFPRFERAASRRLKAFNSIWKDN